MNPSPAWGFIQQSNGKTHTDSSKPSLNIPLISPNSPRQCPVHIPRTHRPGTIFFCLLAFKNSSGARAKFPALSGTY